MGKKTRYKKVEETSESGIRFPMKSGFVILVKPLPPYYKDLLDDLIPLPDYPTRTIKLASGDEIEWEYNVPEEPPASDDPDYPLYMKWEYVDEQRRKLEVHRKRVRQDFLISNCVRIVEGPYNIYDQEWSQRVEAAFPNYVVPTHPGKRMLIFLKTQVILSPDEMEMIVELATSPEASMQGILNALRGFQHIMAEGGSAESDISNPPE